MQKNINNEHDLGYKSILSQKKNFIDFLRDFVKKDWANSVKEENLILIDKEFILDDFKEEEADIVYKVNLNGNEVIFYVLLEFQSKVDFRMPIRLLMYMTEIWRDELRNTEKNIKKRKEYRLPAIVPIVLYNGKQKWTAARNFKEILNGYEEFEDNIVDFRYLLFDVNRMDKEELVEIANVVSSVFLLDQDMNVAEIANRLKLVGKIMRKTTTSEQKKIFNKWVFNVLGNRFEKDKQKEMYKVLIETSEKESDNMVSNLGRNIEKAFKKAEKDGMKIGLEKGREEGREEGELRKAQKVALKMLNKGTDIDDIVEITELSKSEILSLKSKIEDRKN